MKNLLTFSLLFCFVATISGQGNANYIHDYIDKWKNSKKYTLDVLELMPAEDYDYRPNEEEMTFKKLSIHVLQNMIWLSTDYLNGPGFENDLKTIEPTKQELIEITDSAYDYALAALEDLNPHQLEMQVEFFAGPMNIRKILQLMEDHATHHRAQLAVYLRMKGVKPPRYVGW